MQELDEFEKGPVEVWSKLGRILVTHDPDEFENLPIQIHDFGKLPFILEEIQKLVKKTMQDE